MLGGGTVLDCLAHAAPASTVSFPVLRVTCETRRLGQEFETRSLSALFKIR